MFHVWNMWNILLRLEAWILNIIGSQKLILCSCVRSNVYLKHTLHTIRNLKYIIPFHNILKFSNIYVAFGKPLHYLITSLFCISALSFFRKYSLVKWTGAALYTEFTGSFCVTEFLTQFVCLHVVCEWRLIVLQCHVIVLYAPLITYNAQETYHTASHLKIWHIVVWTLICNE